MTYVHETISEVKGQVISTYEEISLKKIVLGIGAIILLFASPQIKENIVQNTVAKSQQNYDNTKGIVKANLPPQIKAMLDTIAWTEGTANSTDHGYKMIFGQGIIHNKPMTSYADHPRICYSFQNTCSTAAGRYQFIDKTWDSTKAELGLKDFSPISQDLAATQLLKNGGIYNLIVNNKTKEAFEKACSIWASLPCSNGFGKYSGQKAKDINLVLDYYNKRLAVYKN
jgi:lysozyme